MQHFFQNNKRMLSIVVFFAMILSLCTGSKTQVKASNENTYEPLILNSTTLNASTVWGKGDSSFVMDADGGFFSSAKQTSGALPDDGKITTSDGITYQLAWTGSSPYAGNDSIRFVGKASNGYVTSSSVTMKLNTYGVYDKIGVLGTAGGFKDNDQSLNFTVTLTYADNSQSTTTYKLYDWYKTSSTITNNGMGYKVYSRLNKNGTSIDNDFGTNGGPMLQSMQIQCDETKVLESITFQIANTSASVANELGIYAAIYAVTGIIKAGAPTSPDISVQMVERNSFTVEWVPVDGANSYAVDVSTYPEFQNGNGEASFISGYLNKVVEGTSVIIDGLDEETTYYCRVRAIGAEGTQGKSSKTVSATTLNSSVPEEHVHDWTGAWTVVKEATAMGAGLAETYCVKGCGEKKQEVIPALRVPPTYTFNYAYDCQRSPAYPKKGDTVTLREFKTPLGANESGGLWELTDCGKYDGRIHTENKSDSIGNIVASLARTYGVSPSQINVFDLQKDGVHICYGVVCTIFDEGVFFVGTTWSGGGGYYLGNEQLNLSSSFSKKAIGDTNNPVQATPPIGGEVNGHHLMYVPAVSSTCKTNGNMPYFICTDSDCGLMFVDANATYTTTYEAVKLAILEHDWTGTWVVTKAPTPTEEGMKETSCVRGCGEKKQETAYLNVKDEIIRISLTNQLTYNGSAQTQEIVVKYGDMVLTEGEHYTVSGNTNTDVGTYTLTVSGKDKIKGTTDVTYVINKATYDMSGIEFSDKTVMYDGAIHFVEIAGTLPAGVTVTYTNNIGITAGTYRAVASFSGNANHYEIPDMEATLTVNKVTVAKPTADNTVFTYNGEPQTYALAESEYYTVNSATAVNAGSYLVNVSLKDKLNYQWADGTNADLFFSFVINKATYDMSNVTFDDVVVAYDGVAHTVVTTGTLPAGVTVAYLNNVGVDAGTYRAVAIFIGDANYYAIPNMEATLTINKVTLERPVADSTIFTYNGQAQTYTLAESEYYAVRNATATNAGSYTVNVYLKDRINYQWDNGTTTDLAYSFVINKANYDMSGVVFPNTVVTYYRYYNYSIFATNLPAGVTATYENNGKTDAGIYTVVAKFTGDANHNAIADMEATLTICKATYDMSKVVFEDKTVTYDGSAHFIEAINLPAGVTVTYENNGMTDAGEYIVVAKFKGDVNYSEIPDRKATLTIKKADGTSSDTVEATQLPDVITVPTMEEKAVNEKGEIVTGIVQDIGAETVIAIPGVTDDKEAEVIWESTNPEVATIDENGKITMVTPGLTEIIVTIVKDGVTKAETIAVVVEEPPKYINDEAEAFKTVRLGTSWEDIPQVRTQTVGETVDINFWGVKKWQRENYEYLWTSSDESVAVVDEIGNVTALKPGVVSVSLGLKNKKTGKFLNVKSVDVVVLADTENKVYLGTSKENTFDSLEIKMNQRLDINFYGVKNWKKEDYDYFWTSSEPTTVWVDKLGKITPIQPGTAVVTLTLVDKKTGYPLYVVPATVTVLEKDVK